MDNSNQTPRELMDEVKGKLIEELNLEEITPEDIDDEASPVRRWRPCLDSIDALEIILILEREYGIKNRKSGRRKANLLFGTHTVWYIAANRKAWRMKIYVTGLGVVSGIGIGVSENIEALRQGKHGSEK